jgi:hypothetical protein
MLFKIRMEGFSYYYLVLVPFQLFVLERSLSFD